ncbi:MGH1-like glycoside hydrolase domain-containing protein [Flexithrix dorotheae]|uniref:MGH1-like glycoside hydrolase domain-containing protein n=1 Tax=Flexithrix dorotheae TaxID=70993 RepID=UPI000377E455|nr:trehalase family glycosidase [Flexithrix dorotheae]
MNIRLLNFILLMVFTLFSCNEPNTEKPAESATASNPVSHIKTSILSGWNNWNNPSVLSYVHMPDGLNLQFKMRKKGKGPYWLDETYVASPKYNFKEKIKPKEHAYDGSYSALHLEWEGTKANIESATDGEDFVLLYTPDSTQENVHILVLETGFLWNKPGSLMLDSEGIKAETANSKYLIQAIGQQTSMPLPISTPYFTFDSDRQVAIFTGKKRTLQEVQEIVKNQKNNLKSNAQKYGDLAPVYEGIQSLVAWNQFYDAFNDRGISSVSRIWNEAWGGYIIFDWDTYFIALVAAIENKALAYNNVFAITKSITDGGFIPNVAATYKKSNDRSQPPVGAMTVKMIYDQYQEKWFLEEVYDELLTWNRWWAKNRDNQGYLSWGSHPHPEGMEANTLQAAKWESGLDNSPMFDEAVFNEETHMLELASVGLMGMYIADCKYLAAISRELGKGNEERELLERAEKYAKKLNELWDENLGIYRDKDLVTGKFTNHLSPTHFYPLLAAVPNQQQAERMVNEHLMNPKEFYGDYMIPSISRNDSAYPDNSYWRGRIWAPMNYLVYMGLRNYDLPEARKTMAEKSTKLLMQEWMEEGHIHENYNAENGEGDDMRNSDPFYAWGGLLGYIPLVEKGFIEIETLKK